MFPPPEFKDRISAVRRIAGRPAHYVDFPATLHPDLCRALELMGRTRLYSHQAEVFEKSRSGAHVVCTTGTSSGKSLAYLLPVLQTVLENPAARVLMIFPTKALAQDQLRGLLDLLQNVRDDKIRAGVYDGDTPPDERTKIRDRAHLVLTNPDMLNSAWLPNHGRRGFANFFRNLTHIVVDEMHTYRGAFGSHVAHVFRRLLRVARHHGSAPQFLASSATIANPVELAEKLCRRPFTLVDRDGSPSAGKTIYFWQPPPINSNFRKSVAEEMASLLPELVRTRRRTIAFCRSRKETEIVLKETRDRLKSVDGGHDESDLVAGYRGGYTPEERRHVQEELTLGRLFGVVSTNALELGVDIGSLDFVIQGGFPGTRASFWQQLGRAGRRDREAHGVILLKQAPVDQFLARDPDWILRTSAEHAVIDPDNLMIQLAHARAACAELPLTLDDLGHFRDLGEVVAVLQKAGEVESLHGAFFWRGSPHPAGEFSLRNLDGDRFKIVDRTRGLTLTEMDRPQTYHEAHPRAVYLHDGQQYLVEDLDLVGHKVTVVPVEQDFYTEPDVRTTLSLLRRQADKKLPRVVAGFGDVNVEDSVVGYKMLQFRNHQNLGYEVVEPHLVVNLETEAAWFEVPRDVLSFFGGSAEDYLGGMIHALVATARLTTMAESSDLSGASFLVPALEGVAAHTALVLYDHHPGGLGFAAKSFENLEEIIENAAKLVDSCSCATACPACVGDGRLERRAVAWALKSVFVALPVPADLNIPQWPQQVKTQPRLVRVPFADVEKSWPELVEAMQALKRPGSEFIGQVHRARVFESILFLRVESAWIRDWAKTPEVLRSLRTLVDSVVVTPPGFQIDVEVIPGLADQRSLVKDKLRRRLDDLHGPRETGESH